MGNIDKFNDKDSFLKNFESLRPDLFFPENWSDEEKSKAVDIVRPQKTRTSMFSSIPMNCESIKCIFASTCPLLKENLAPKGKPCPLEMSMVAQFTSEYMDQLDVHEENASNLLGKTAYYNPMENSITLYTMNRHPKDILRSFSHEMVHHEQNLDNRLSNINTTNTNEDGDLPEIEKEAYEKGNMMLRNWEDTIKNV